MEHCSETIAVFGAACLEYLVEKESPIYWVLGSESTVDVEHCSETVAVFGAACLELLETQRCWFCD